jgi:hypothetical protein
VHPADAPFAELEAEWLTLSRAASTERLTAWNTDMDVMQDEHKRR